MVRNVFRKTCIALFILLLVAGIPFASAQVTTTGIHGIVKDSSGAVVPNVTITIVDTATQTAATAHSEADGGFVFVNLLSGMYRLTASVSGFQTAILDNVKVDSGRTLDIALELKVGTSTEKVEVTAAGVQLETTAN
jgi:hypothetical protein